MDSDKKFVTGLDIGSENTRAVILAVGEDGACSVVGYSEGKSEGMRKGAPSNLNGPASVIDPVIGKAERMNGYEVKSAFVSVNGSSVCSMQQRGIIAFDSRTHEINRDDLEHLKAATLNDCVLTNREVLDVVALEYCLDGQAGVKDPLGMCGERLELRICVVSALAQVCENLRKITDLADVSTLCLVPSVIAAARAVLTERQKENGVAIIDMGARTTSVAVYEEGDLQYVGVVAAGSYNISRDLAIMLTIDPEQAEEIKQRFVTGNFESEKSSIIRIGREGKDERAFDRREVEEVVKARLNEIFGEVRRKLKTAHYDQRLPEGVVLVGGGAKMRDIDLFAKQALEAAARIGVPQVTGGAADAVTKPEFAAAVGLALLAADEGQYVPQETRHPAKAPKKASKLNLGAARRSVKKFFEKF